MTAALLNTHVRDNFLQTAPAKVTTAGDLVYATGANTLARLALGTTGQFLRGGASAPTWTNELDIALLIKTTEKHLRLHESDGADPEDYWSLGINGVSHILQFHDDSAGSFKEALHVDTGDFVLHTGTVATGTGAVVIKSDASGAAEAATTTGSTVLSVSITTGGPAWVSGQWSARILRIAAGAASDTISFLPRDDGANLSSGFNHEGDWAENNIPNNGDVDTMTGIWYKRTTEANTSAWQMFVLASTNSIFTYSVRMLVTSVQYPT